jgi:hypothetical protein
MISGSQQLHSKTGPGSCGGLGVRRIVCSAVRAADQDPVNLVFLGVQQSRTASAAGIIHGMVAGLKNGRSLQNDTSCRRGDDLKADLPSGH